MFEPNIKAETGEQENEEFKESWVEFHRAIQYDPDVEVGILPNHLSFFTQSTIGEADGNYPSFQIEPPDLGMDFPLSLVKITRAELKTLLEIVDPTPDSVRESGAIDWANLNDRLHFIVDFFRCYQEEKDMLLPPFSAEQVQRLKAGKVPDGTL